MKKEKAAEAAQKSPNTANDTSASWQRARVIQALRTGPKTTVELHEVRPGSLGNLCERSAANDDDVDVAEGIV